MSWKDIIKEDDFPRYVPRDSSYVSVEEQEQRGQYLFDKKNIGRIYRNKVNNTNWLFKDLLRNGDIVLVSQPDEKEYNTMREKLQASIDKTKEAYPKRGINSNADKLIEMTQSLMDKYTDEELDRPIEKEETMVIPPVFGLNYDLLPEQ